MRVWITRAEPGASETAARVAALGLEPVVSPVLAVERLWPALDLQGVAALAFTSRNGAEAFAAMTERRDLPVWAVGEATAAAARRLGFLDVRAGGGDVAALGAAVAAQPPAGALFYAAPAEPAGDLPGALRAAGVEVRTAVVYRTVVRDAPIPEDVDAVLVHSPRAARTLAARGVLPVWHLCLSEAVAEPLRAAGADVRVATRPDESALLALLPARS